MLKVMFVCHGNICRSPMAEALFRYMIEKEDLKEKIYVNSSATSYEEIDKAVAAFDEYIKNETLAVKVEKTEAQDMEIQNLNDHETKMKVERV